jgi:hypothetical protein
MSKIIIVKKSSNKTAPQPCPWMIDAPEETRK